jgi:hypothetical protein
MRKLVLILNELARSGDRQARPDILSMPNSPSQGAGLNISAVADDEEDKAVLTGKEIAQS